MSRKKETFSKVSQVKKESRVSIGPVPPTRVVPKVDRATKDVTKHPKKAIETAMED